jgi:hypothetical protein
MPTNITKTLRKALKELQAERKQIDRQIGAIETALAGGGLRQRRATSRRAKGRKAGRKAMSAAARKAVGRRMKAYWAKRRAKAAKAKEKAGK